MKAQENNQLVEIVNESGLDKPKAESILAAFAEPFKSAKALADESRSIIITDEDDREGMQKARVKRLKLKAIRCDIEEIRKGLKEQIVREGKAIDGMANILKALIVPAEEYLETQEKFAELCEIRRNEERYRERVALLTPYVRNVAAYDLLNMSEDGFKDLLSDSKIAAEAVEKARVEEEARQAAARKAEEARRKETEAENVRLKAEAEKREKENKKAQEKLAKDREIAEKKANEEKEKRLAMEREIEAKQRAVREEADRQAKAEAEAKRKMELAPDKEKLEAMLESLDAIDAYFPECTSKEAKEIVMAANENLVSTIDAIREMVESLE